MAASSSEQNARLLLLPSCPTDTLFAAIKATYGPALDKVLTESAGHGVDIAILCENLHDYGFQAPRRTTYHALQHIIAGIYRLVVLVCAERGIDLDRRDQVDPRVLALAGSSTTSYTPQGPVVTLHALASCARSWDTVYAIESEAGEKLLEEFTTIRRQFMPKMALPGFKTCRVLGGTSIKLEKLKLEDAGEDTNKRHNSVIVGGTFDHLHLGHRLLLTATALVLDPPASGDYSERSLVVGLTGDELLKEKKYAEILEDWELRCDEVFKFLRQIMVFDESHEVLIRRYDEPGPNGKAVHYTFHDGLVIKVVEISDAFGPTITEKSITALIISGETRSGGKAVNDKREEKGWAPLEVFEVDVLEANSEQETDSFQSKLSSSEIRKRLQQKSSSNL